MDHFVIDMDHRPTDMDHRTALEHLAELRSSREQLLAQLADGSTDLRSVLSGRSDEPSVGEVKLLAVLESLPGARKVTTRRALAELGLGERIRLRELDDDTAAELSARFPLPDAP